MQITRGKIQSAQKVVAYGPEGIGKSTFAAQFPNPVFIDTEGSTKHMDVARTPRPSSWTMLIEQVKYFKAHPQECNTLVLDTADWAEQLCINEICSKSQKNGIEDFGYGKGYVYLAEEFGRLLNLLEELVELGINIVFTAHAQMRKFEQPDEMGAYDRWEMKLQKKTAPLLREWSDMLLFANYETFVINVDGQGVAKGKNKAQGGKRVMYTTHHSCWDAKNRHDLPDKTDLNYAAIAHCIPTRDASVPIQKNAYLEDTKPIEQPVKAEEQKKVTETVSATTVKPQEEQLKIDLSGIPQQLADLMAANQITQEEIQQAVASKGYYPQNTPIQNYDPDFISGVLVGAWSQVFQMIKDFRDDVPF
ncbi:phage protein [Syntrophobotulus glycolicus DSM 8271]|uniref:Phage protein n=1 Tax=Syntrophobotulus glycolicus (strain DSM 8271 / FlGlyR) TaxID=645991 RepID=F0SXE1_SYNGF|nr:ATP-binding protein [Syntrophobotulus glycolicus]ADY54687.1 phage protein [Syntrophobotulus glycolicus DSM 8271]